MGCQAQCVFLALKDDRAAFADFDGSALPVP
jgi:hypothetical protein